MKKMILAACAIALVAGSAFAGTDMLSSLNKTPVVKDAGDGGANKGLLDCSGAIEIALDNVYVGTNVGAPNNVSTYGCSTWNESGGEVVYHLYLAAPAMFTADIAGNGCDLDMAVLDGCDETLNCLIVVDSGVQTNVPVSGDFYFVVDGYNGAACDFTFSINSAAVPEPASFCANVLDVTGTYFEGDTCDGANEVSALGCEDYTEAGLEDYYEVFMPAGSSFTVDVTNTADGALWVVDSCVEPMNCLAYADNTLTGQAETVSYTNTGADTTVFIVIDSWGTGSCGTYTMNFSSTGGAVASESTTFGAVKAMFR
ncbi:MAG TPA: hypothetical protein PLQ13_07735 [Candidatus Krumholzibacteria bacterium]|nr:hypothetical protein [Candidatus Krumholzibacteria bacterium]